MSEPAIALLLVAPFVGSFLACMADRLAIGQPILVSRSQCDACGHTLGPSSLVPILSWIVQKARCRYCEHPIAIYYPAAEVSAILVVLWAQHVTSGWVLFITVGMGWVLLVLAFMDLRHMVLSNILTLGLLLVGIFGAFILKPTELMDHIAGAAIGLAALYSINLLYSHLRHRQGLGMGDVKLLGAAGAWLTWQGLPTVLLYASVAALVVTLVVHSTRLSVRPDLKVPFGLYLCLGFWLTWLYGPVEFGGVS